MNLTRQELIYGATLGGLVGVGYRLATTAWGDGAAADLAIADYLVAAVAGAAAEVLALQVRKSL